MHSLDPNKHNDQIANLADEMKKCLESPLEHCDVETDEKTFFNASHRQSREIQVAEFLFEIKCRRV